MNRPRDYHPTETVGAIRTARLFSNVVSPPVMFAVLGLVLSWRQLSFWPGLAWAIVFGFFVSLAPILLIIYLLKTGRIAELHMTDTRERRIPYLAGLLSSLVAFLLIDRLDGPSYLHCLSLLSAVELTILGLITNFWLISIHTATVAGTVTIATAVFGLTAAILLLPLVFLVSAVRLYLRRHSIAQVLAGLSLGTSIGLFFVWTGCFGV